MIFEVIEGATPLEDVSGLLLAWVQNQEDLNRVEAENIADAQRKYLRASSKSVDTWFSFEEFKNIHKAMFGNVWDWAGKQRRSFTSIGVQPGLIPMNMAQLCEEVCAWSTEPIELSFLEKSARIHHRLVFIHPFENGNGRFSRLVADRYLLCWKASYPSWPENINKDGLTRNRYIQTLKIADEGNYEPLVVFMKDLGAMEPSINLLMQDRFFRSYMHGDWAIAKIQALVRSDKKWNKKSPNDEYILQSLLRSKLQEKVKLELLKVLIKEGADVNRKDKSGLTPLQVAVNEEERDCAILLRSNGAIPAPH